MTSFKEDQVLPFITIVSAGVAGAALAAAGGRPIDESAALPMTADGERDAQRCEALHIQDFRPLPEEDQRKFGRLWPNLFPREAPPCGGQHGPSDPYASYNFAPGPRNGDVRSLLVPPRVNWDIAKNREVLDNPSLRYEKDYREWYDNFQDFFFGANSPIKWQPNGVPVLRRGPQLLSIEEKERFEKYLHNSPETPPPRGMGWNSSWSVGASTAVLLSSSEGSGRGSFSSSRGVDAADNRPPSGMMSGLGIQEGNEGPPPIRGDPENPSFVPYIGYTFRGPPAELDRISILPRHIVFDLDGIIWNHAMRETSGPPMFDTKTGVNFMLFDDVLEIISWCQTQQIRVAFTSRQKKSADAMFYLSCYCTSFGTPLSKVSAANVFGTGTKAKGIAKVKKMIGGSALDTMYIASRQATREECGKEHIVFHLTGGLNWREFIARLAEYEKFLGPQRAGIGLVRKPVLKWHSEAEE